MIDVGGIQIGLNEPCNRGIRLPSLGYGTVDVHPLCDHWRIVHPQDVYVYGNQIGRFPIAHSNNETVGPVVVEIGNVSKSGGGRSGARNRGNSIGSVRIQSPNEGGIIIVHVACGQSLRPSARIVLHNRGVQFLSLGDYGGGVDILHRDDKALASTQITVGNDQGNVVVAQMTLQGSTRKNTSTVSVINESRRRPVWF